MQSSSGAGRPFDVTHWSERRARLLLAATLWPIVYLVGGALTVVVLVALNAPFPSGSVLIAVFCLHLLTALMSTALTVIYLIVVVQSPVQPPNSRTVWIIVVVLLGIMAFPFVYHSFVWGPRRTAAGIASADGCAPTGMGARAHG